MAGHRVMKNGKIQIIITHGTDYTGKPKRYYKTVDACSKKKLAEEDARFLAEILEGDAGSNKSTMTVEDLWITFQKERCRELKPSTVARYGTLYKQHIEKYFSKRRIDEINRSDIRSWVNDLASTTKLRDRSKLISNKTISNALGLLRTMFNFAVYELEAVEKNPCVRIKLPKRDVFLESRNAEKGRPIDIIRGSERYSEAECIELMNALMKNRTANYAALRHTVLIITIIFTGLRTAEIMALRWTDVDFEKKNITVERSRVFVQGVGVSLNSTKTDSSVRQISIPDVVADLLIELKTAQDELRRDFGRSYTPSGYIASLEDGKPQNPRTTYDWLRYFQKKHDLRPCTIHDLRHMHAAMLTRIGVDIIDVSKRLGHSNTRITQEVYEYLFKSIDDEIGKELNEYYRDVIANDR